MNTISSALSGMNAALSQLDTAANNIANSQTPGYRRLEVAQQAVAGGGVTTTIVQPMQQARRWPKTSSRR